MNENCMRYRHRCDNLCRYFSRARYYCKKLCFFIALYILNYKKVKNGIDNELCKEYNMQHRVHVYANKKCIVKSKKYILKE